MSSFQHNQKMKSNKPVIIADNGGHTLKIGGSDSNVPSACLTNSTARVKKSMEFLIADRIDQYLNGSLLQFSRPLDRGYITNWKSEIAVWSYAFQDHCHATPSDSRIVLTEAPLNPETIQNETNEVVFEYFGYKDCLRRPSIWFSHFGAISSKEWNPENIPACLVVDSGFSFTHVAPFINGHCDRDGLKRINIGGKLLTNYLKELVSYRQWNMMDEFLLMNQVKEQLCYVSDNMIEELQSAKYTTKNHKYFNMLDMEGTRLRKSFVLPDFQRVMKGYVKPDDEPYSNDEQLLVMETERFSVPEPLFNPIDIGLQQAGLPEAIQQSLFCLDEVHAAAASQSIILTGGNTKFPNFQSRLERELRPLLPEMFDMQVHQPESPELFAWQGAQMYVEALQRGVIVENPFVSKKQYDELGSYRVNQIYDSGW